MKLIILTMFIMSFTCCKSRPDSIASSKRNNSAPSIYRSISCEKDPPFGPFEIALKSKPIITNGEPIRLAGVVNFTNKLGSKIWDAEIKSVERVTLAKYAEGSFLKVKAVSVKESYQTAYPAEKIEIWIPLSWLLHDSKDYPTRIEKLVASYYADEIISGGGNFREAVEANGFKNCKSVGTVND